MKNLGIVELHAVRWLKKKINITKQQEQLVREFAQEIETLMEIKENNEKN